MKKKIGLIASLAFVTVFFVIAATQTFEEGAPLNASSFIFAGLFIAMVILLLTEAVPDWVAVIGTCAMLVLSGAAFLKAGIITENVFTWGGLFGSFSGSTIWLLIMVFILAAGIGKSGLINRIALGMLSLFPPTYGGAVLAMMLTGTVISPLIPSVNAKVNIIIPFATATTEEMKLEPRSKGALGLFTACYMTAYISGNSFITGSVYVSVMIGFISSYAASLGAEGAIFTFSSWFVATVIWFAAILAGTFIYCYIMCRPKEKIAFSKNYFKDRLKELGPMKRNEKIAMWVLIAALLLWSTSKFHGLDTAMIGWIAVCVMCVLGLLSPADFNQRIPWSLCVFIGCLLGIANYVGSTGWNEYLAGSLAPVLSPLVSNPWIFIPFLCVFTYLFRFIIIDFSTALVIIMAIFGGMMSAAGINIFVIVFVVFMSSMVWNLPYTNPFAMATLGVAGGKYVTFNEMRKASYLFMILNIIGCTASIPLWTALGFLK